jgi:hypothetical protein
MWNAALAPSPDVAGRRPAAATDDEVLRWDDQALRALKESARSASGMRWARRPYGVFPGAYDPAPGRCPLGTA